MENTINIPKILHVYWDGSSMSFLQMLTLTTFNNFNPKWEIYLWMPENKNSLKTWKSYENKAVYTGKDYFEYITKIENVIIKTVNFKSIGFYDDVSEIFKSDYLRYWALHKYGGIYADFDIIFIKPIFECFRNINLLDKSIDAVTIVYNDNKTAVFPIGFLMANKNSIFFKYILDNIHKYFNKNEYQSIGASMLVKLFTDHTQIINRFENVIVLQSHSYLPYKWNELENIFSKSVDKIKDDTIGIHWFNGAPYCKKFQNLLGDIEKTDTLPIGIIFDYIEPFFNEFKKNNK